MILGIDPGLKGGLVLISEKGMAFMVMPTVENQLDLPCLADWIIEHAGPTAKVYLEKVHSMPKQGVSSSFKFGRVFGAVEGILAAVGAPYTLVTPQRWMKEMHQGVEQSLDSKARSLVAAQRLFPSVNLTATERSKVPHSGLVDALLIAEYGRRQNDKT